MNLRRCFITWNNYDKDFENRDLIIDYFQSLPNFKGALLGFETGEKENTNHIQGVVFFTQPKTFNTLRKYFKNNHIEKIISLSSALEYCKKENDYIEIGTIPKSKQQLSASQDFIYDIISGTSKNNLMENYPTLYLRYAKDIDFIRNESNYEYYKIHTRNVRVIYIGGYTGIGKSYLPLKLFGIENVYRCDLSDRYPFDNYNGEKVLILEEFDFKNVKIEYLLQLLDIYPLRLSARYNDKIACFNLVIINSNISINENIDIKNNEQYKAFYRRINYSNYFYNRKDLESFYINDLPNLLKTTRKENETFLPLYLDLLD